MQTQNERVLDYMREFHGITAMEAQSEIGCMRLASRIWDLRRAGHAIVSMPKEVINRFGEIVRVAEYHIEEDI